MHLVKSLICSEKGATAVEYGLIVALIAIAAIAAINGVANSTGNMWDHVAEEITSNS
ncbi:Flp family type IVb pilin [Parasphingorhabdus sp. JC815]|uniref:Flp family type IVb pilin n=1 Tax=Parasphingorhabdus sp. JC815 TaxID=3232140 RepID=UPI00345896A3